MTTWWRVDPPTWVLLGAVFAFAVRVAADLAIRAGTARPTIARDEKEIE